jgi:hypothetical protein
MLFLHNKIMANKFLATVEIEQLIDEQDNATNSDQKLSQIIWHLFAGELPYRNIMLKILDVAYSKTC